MTAGSPANDAAAATGHGRATVVVPAWNSRDWLPGCLDGLRRQSCRPAATIVVDDGSTDGTADLVRERYPEVELVALGENRGFAHAANLGVDRAASPYVALLNADTRPEPDWLARLVERLDAGPAEVVAVASRMLKLADPALIDDAGDELSWYGSARKRGHGRPAGEYATAGEVLSACGGAALYRRQTFLAVGGFDETYGSYFEDLDFGLRCRVLGYRAVYEPAAVVLHQGQGSGLPRASYVRAVTRNRLLTVVKNIPARLLAQHSHRLSWGQLYFFVAYRRPLQSALGWAGFLRALPRALGERRRILAQRKVTDEELDALLTRELGEPPLGELLRRKLRGAA